jgi:hypothetical protein
MEEYWRIQRMLKKAALAAFGLMLAMTFTAPQKATAQVHVGVGINIGAPVVVAPAPVVVAPPPLAVYDDAFFVANPWTVGFHGGWYYEGGTRYWMDGHHHRHYDDRYREARYDWVRHHHDNGWHGEHPRGHDNWHGDHGRGHQERADRERHDNGWHGDR